MSDIADDAQDHIERENVDMLVKARKPAGPDANGLCHWCRDLWTRAQEAWRRNHGSTAQQPTESKT